ncbi:MAG: aminodeoxyfutalosine synthase, partial [Acidobacteriota bacterium]|nr:aminodeoxyfutalosine synthase [Acidobacteriota bacterium]
MSTPLAPESFPSDLRPLATKVRDGVRLSPEDALLCFETPHVLALGRLANAVRRRMHGNTVFYNLNRHINPTNVCVYTYNCKFCSYAAMKGEAKAWEMSHEEIY